MDLDTKGGGEMWMSRFTYEQITDALRRADAGEAVTEICRKMGISRQAFYQWRSKYKGMGMMWRRVRWLEEENQKLKHLIMNLKLNNALLKEVSKALLPENGNSASGNRKIYAPS
jgi:putative transposase